MTEFIRGTCEDMCPPQEIKMRTKEHLLHFYEIKSNSDYTPQNVVKSFSRSAAGIKTPKKSDLRTIRALNKTVEYLLKEIIMDKRKHYGFAYDFIFDRLRCVRQEIVMQNLDNYNTIKLLEPMILFLAYSSYRLCPETIDNFDPKICNQHFQECLKKVLCCYDEIYTDNKSNGKLIDHRNRCFIEALYLIFNLGSADALERSLILPDNIKKDKIFKLSQLISLEYFRGNVYKVLQGIKELPHILCAIGSLKLQTIRKILYHQFSHAYNSKQLTVKIEWIQKLLLYSNTDDVTNDCKYYNIEIISNLNDIKFSKNNFDIQKSIIKSKHENFVEEKLKLIYLPEILLLKKL